MIFSEGGGGGVLKSISEGVHLSALFHLSNISELRRVLEKIPIVLRVEIKYQLFLKGGMCGHFDLLLLLKG